MTSPITSIHQEVTNTLGRWLQSQLPDYDVRFHWPSESNPVSHRITVLIAGRPQYQWLDEFAFNSTPPTDGSNLWTFSLRVAQVELPVQLDVWQTSHVLLDDGIQRVENALHANKAATLGRTDPQPMFEAQLALQLAPPWDQVIAGYLFDSTNYGSGDIGTETQRSEWRESFRGTAAYDLIATIKAPKLNTVILKEWFSTSLNTNPPPGTIAHILTITNGSTKSIDGP